MIPLEQTGTHMVVRYCSEALQHWVLYKGIKQATFQVVALFENNTE